MAIETVSKNAAVYPTAPVNTNMTSVSSAGTVTESVSTEKVALNPEVGKVAVNSNMDTVKKVYSSEDEDYLSLSEYLQLFIHQNASQLPCFCNHLQSFLWRKFF